MKKQSNRIYTAFTLPDSLEKVVLIFRSEDKLNKFIRDYPYHELLYKGDVHPRHSKTVSERKRLAYG